MKFDNIHADHDFGYGKEGSVVVYGEAEFCVNPCTGDPGENNTNCNNCDPTSTLLLEFDRYLFSVQNMCIIHSLTYLESVITCIHFISV